MARRFFRGRGRFGRPRLPTKWAGDVNITEGTQTAGGQTATVILESADYIGGTTGNVEAGGATLLRIRGAVNLRATVIGGLALLAIVKIDEGGTFANLNTAAAFYSGDVLWYDTVMVPTDTARHIEIDVRTRRRLERDAVYFIIYAVAQTITYAGHWRVLIRSSG